MRTCTKCGETKPATLEFFPKKRNALDSRCRLCDKAIRHAYEKRRWAEDADYREYRRAYKKTDAYKKKAREYNALRWADPAIQEGRRAYRRTPEQRAKTNDYNAKRRENPEHRALEAAYKKTARYKAWDKEYSRRPEVRARQRDGFQRLKNSPRYDRFRALARERENARKRADPVFHLRVVASAAVLTMMKNYIPHEKKGRRSWESLLGYGAEELRRHLEAQFHDGMSWANHGRNGWHIDHVIPISWWMVTSTDDPNFKLCWALRNLQPLWASDNRSKNATLATFGGVTYTRMEWIAAGRPLPK